MKNEIRIVFLHHSTGQNIWNGSRSKSVLNIVGKVGQRFYNKFFNKPRLPRLFEKYNKEYDTNYKIDELTFPKRSPYGWKNYPYDYYNIWVKNSGNRTYMDEPTLEILTKKYQVIIFKHCFPVSNIQSDNALIDINSDFKSLANYKLQYLALRDKLSEFHDTKFILFTGPARVKSQISEDEAGRAKEFYNWVVKEWDRPDDNIYIWDFYYLQTEGGIYLKDDKAVSIYDSHPNEVFSDYASELLFNRVIDIIETNGSRTTLTGE